jgi:hypothetical protein
MRKDQVIRREISIRGTGEPTVMSASLLQSNAGTRLASSPSGEHFPAGVVILLRSQWVLKLANGQIKTALLPSEFLFNPMYERFLMRDH